jgi:hypothetical protein
MRSPVQAARLRIGDRVRFSGMVRTVIGLSGTVVRLADAGGALTEVTLAELVNSSDFGRAGVPGRSPLPPVSPLDGLPEAAVAEALWWERHIAEVLHGTPPDASPGTAPKPEYDPGLVSLTRREQAKAAELRAAGRPVSASAVKQRRRRYQAGGLAGMVDHRIGRRTPPYGRADQRVIDAMRQAISEAAGASTRTASYIFWRTGQILDAAHGAGTVELPSRASLYLAQRVDMGRRFKVGDRVEGAFVVDTLNSRITYTLVAGQEDPWPALEKQFPLGKVFTGTVRSVVDNVGPFVSVDDNVNGLIPERTLTGPVPRVGPRSRSGSPRWTGRTAGSRSGWSARSTARPAGQLALCWASKGTGAWSGPCPTSTAAGDSSCWKSAAGSGPRCCSPGT